MSGRRVCAEAVNIIVERSEFLPDVSESTRLCGTTGYNKSNRIQSARRLVHYRMRCSRVSAFGTRKRTTPFSAVSEVVSTSSPFSFFRTRDGRVPPMSMFMGTSDGADGGSAVAEGASIATSAAAWVSSAEGSFAYRIQASQHRLKARDFFFENKEIAGRHQRPRLDALDMPQTFFASCSRSASAS